MIRASSRRTDRRQIDRQRKERQSKQKSRWFSRRIDIPEYAIRIHFHKRSEPYRDPQQPDVFYPWKKGAKHWIQKYKKFTECAFKECLTCAHRNPRDFDLENVQAKKFLSECWPKHYYSFSAFVEEWHVIVERESDRKDDNGNPRLFTERLREREARELFQEQGHNWVDIKDQLGRVYGKQGYLDLSSPAWNNEFAAVFEEVERMCKDGGYLFPDHYACELCHEEVFPLTSVCPNCGSDQVLINPDEHRAECLECEHEWPLLESQDRDLRKDADAIHVCPHCNEQTYVYPKLLKLVDVEDQMVDDEEPEDGWDAYDIFDIQMKIRKEKSTDDSPPKIVIDEWAIQPLDHRLFDAEHQGGKGDETAEKVAKGNRTPLDLDLVHAPDGPEVQAKVLKLDNVFSQRQTPAQRPAVRYSRKKPTNGKS